MQASAQIIERNLDDITSGLNRDSWVWFIDIADASLLAQWPTQHAFWTDHAGTAEAATHTHALCTALGIEAYEQLVQHFRQPPAAVVLKVPKSRSRTDFLLAQLAHCLPESTALYLVGHKKEGIEGGAKLLKQRASTVDKRDSARHCQLWRAELAPQAFDPEAWLQPFELPVPEAAPLQLATLPGVFSLGKLDRGTRVLLDNLHSTPLSIKKDAPLLDFAAGAGPIALWLKRRYADLNITLVDVSAIALFCAWMNAQANDMEVVCQQADGLQGVDGEWQAIVSNPPFHTGVETDYRIAEQFIHTSWQRLKRGGELRLVANGHLPYAEWIEAQFGQCERLANEDGFHVYRAFKRT